MANHQQLRLLKNRVEAWNQWREANPEVVIDLSGANLKAMALRGINLSRADLRGTNFTQADLTGANITQAKGGLQKRWAVFLTLLAWFVSVVSSLFTSFASVMASLALNVDLTDDFSSGWIVLLGLLALYILLLRKDLNSVMVVFAIATICTVAIVSLIALGTGSVAGTGAALFVVVEAFAFVFAWAVALVGAAAFALAMAVVETLTLAFTFAVAVAFAFAFAFAVAVETATIAFTFSCAIVLTFLNAYIGFQSLRGDEKYAVIRSLAVSCAAIGGTSFREAVLTDADFHKAQLKSSDYRKAIVTRTHWYQSENLDYARCGGTILDVPAIRDLAVTHKGRRKSYVGQSLKGINLRKADLSDADLTAADLSDATFEDAVLERANLSRVQALRTQFRQANLSATCLESWNIDSTTQLEDVVCDHVYLLNGQQERRPNSGSFAPGEFTKLFQEVLDTIDLIFRDGVDWRAFVQTFWDIQVQNEDTALAIQSIENKGDGVVVVKVRASEEADKAKIHAEFSEIYQVKLQALEAEYRAELKAKDSEISSYRRENSNMLEITKLLASKSMNVTNNNQGATIGNFANRVGDSASQNISYDAEQNPVLVGVAGEIQAVLDQFSATRSTETLTQKAELVEAAIAHIQTNPARNQKILNILTTHPPEALAPYLNHPAATLFIEAIKDWKPAES